MAKRTAKGCTGKNADGKPCKMPPLRGKKRCLAHSPKAAAATAARKKGGRRRAQQQQQAAAARAEERSAWEKLDSVADVEKASARVFVQLMNGEIGAKEAASAAKLLTILREGAVRRERARLRSKIAPVKKGDVDGAKAIAELVATFREVVAEAKADKGMSPEDRRDQVIRAGAVLIKVAEPYRMLGELTDELRELIAIKSGQQGGAHNGVQEPPAGAEGLQVPPD
jgi:hypothetical protein